MKHLRNTHFFLLLPVIFLRALSFVFSFFTTAPLSVFTITLYNNKMVMRNKYKM